jgi:HD-GYP domain-containing protein (c-di-GMP phosphodiesterase class II)
MLEHHGAVLSRLFSQPFTAAFLGAVLEHDYETHRHLLNVGALCARVATTAGLSSEEAIVLGQAGLFHDVGKLHIRAVLLNATHALTDAEWRIMRAHAARGEQMLLAQGAHALAAIVRGHHERLDGSGYPDGLRGLAIPWETRLLAVVDAYDAMRSGRPYAAAIQHEDALDRLSAARTLFDPDAVHALTMTLGTHRPPRLKAVAPIS